MCLVYTITLISAEILQSFAVTKYVTLKTGPLKGYFAIPDIDDFENPIFDIDLKFAIFDFEKIDIRYWVSIFDIGLPKIRYSKQEKIDIGYSGI